MRLHPRLTKHDPARLTGLCEVFCDHHDAAGAGFVLARLMQTASPQRPVMWVQDAMSARETGVPSIRGLEGWGVPDGMIRVCVRNAADLLWVVEEGLRCSALSAVVAEVWGTPGALSFTATKRLVLSAASSGVPAYLLRVSASPSLSAAHERWRVSSLPSAPHPHDLKAPGDPRWSLDLFRARWQQRGMWHAQYDRTAHRLDLVAKTGNGALDPATPARGYSAAQ